MPQRTRSFNLAGTTIEGDLDRDPRIGAAEDHRERLLPQSEFGLPNGGRPCGEADVALEQQVEACRGELWHTARVVGARPLSGLHLLENCGTARRHTAPASLPHRVPGFTRQRENA